MDCSHANAQKRYELQAEVVADVAARIASGSSAIFGMMIESNLVAGAQRFSPGIDVPASLAYGQSITDASLGWDESVAVMEKLTDAVVTARGR